MLHLSDVYYLLPNKNKEFIEIFCNYLAPVGKVGIDNIALRTSQDNLFPMTTFLFTSFEAPRVLFSLSDCSSITIELANTTGISKVSPHIYSPISLQEYIQRIAPFPLQYIDHTGFNLPYFDGIHPYILELRERLKSVSLYHTFPEQLEKDVPWDFVFPASHEELANSKTIDYSIVRRPKIEIVSFDKSSTPLIQLDLHLEGVYADWVELFPEGLAVPETRSVWIYIENDFGIDICFVLNEIEARDWGYHFANSRLP